MGKIFCVEFQRNTLKFHTKYFTHTLRESIFMQCWKLQALRFTSAGYVSLKWLLENYGNGECCLSDYRGKMHSYKPQQTYHNGLTLDRCWPSSCPLLYACKNRTQNGPLLPTLLQVWGLIQHKDQNMNSHCGDKAAIRSSYPKIIVFLYWKDGIFILNQPPGLVLAQ